MEVKSKLIFHKLPFSTLSPTINNHELAFGNYSFIEQKTRRVN